MSRVNTLIDKFLDLSETKSLNEVRSRNKGNERHTLLDVKNINDIDKIFDNKLKDLRQNLSSAITRVQSFIKELYKYDISVSTLTYTLSIKNAEFSLDSTFYISTETDKKENLEKT